MTKKLSALILSVIMLFCLMPTAVFAAENNTCPFIVIGGSDGTDYTWDDIEKKLTIKNSDLTISTKESYTAVSPASAVIVVENDVTTLTLAGVNITAPISGGALNTTSTLNITLADGTTNTLTGGSMTDNASSSYGIYAAGELTISGDTNGTGSLKATGGTASDSGVSAGIYSDTSITIDGGTVEATGGTSSSGSYGIYANAGEGAPSITIKGGNVTAKHSGTAGLGIGGSATFSTGTDGNAIIHVSSFGSSITKASQLSGIIFEGNAGKVYGEQTLGENFTIASGETLTIPSGAKLTNNGTLTIEQNGTLTVEQGGTLVNNGTINNQGSIVNNGTIDNTNGTLTGNAPTGSGTILSLPAHTHTYGEWKVTTPATCTATGTKTRTCIATDCTQSETQEIPATGHSPQNVAAKAPTYDTAGNIEYWYCAACNSYFKDGALTQKITLADTVIAKLEKPTEPEKPTTPAKPVETKPTEQEKREQAVTETRSEIESTPKGGSVTIDADDDENGVHWSIMDAARENGVGLKIEWNGETITIPADKIPNEKYKTYYTYEYLAKQFGKMQAAEIPAVPNTGAPINLIITLALITLATTATAIVLKKKVK